MLPNLVIRQMIPEDVEAIVVAFAGWHKNRRHLQLYLRQQEQGERVVLVALLGGALVGYTTVVWSTLYEPFREAGIPEIVDLNVVPALQGRGIGTALIQAAERAAAEHSIRTIGISAGQTPEDAVANHLYLKLGYVPDGKGITSEDGELHLVKTLPDGKGL